MLIYNILYKSYDLIRNILITYLREENKGIE